MLPHVHISTVLVRQVQPELAAILLFSRCVGMSIVISRSRHATERTEWTLVMKKFLTQYICY
jgi:hypothetical protein